jgi:hypothetical protein
VNANFFVESIYKDVSKRHFGWQVFFALEKSFTLCGFAARWAERLCLSGNFLLIFAALPPRVRRSLTRLSGVCRKVGDFPHIGRQSREEFIICGLII